jgi:hypothetical protein
VALCPCVRACSTQKFRVVWCSCRIEIVRRETGPKELTPTLTTDPRTTLLDDGHATLLLYIRGNPPSLPPHRPRLRNRQPQTDRPRSYVRPRRSHQLLLLAHNDRPTKPLLFFPYLPDVLVCSTRPAPRLTDLRTDELAELMRAIQRVGRVVERAYKADGLTIACQVPSSPSSSSIDDV